MKHVLSWRALVLGGYAAWTLACTFAFGGGWTALLFMGTWGGVWLGFSLWWRWASQARQTLLRRHGYY